MRNNLFKLHRNARAFSHKGLASRGGVLRTSLREVSKCKELCHDSKYLLTGCNCTVPHTAILLLLNLRTQMQSNSIFTSYRKYRE